MQGTDTANGHFVVISFPYLFVLGFREKVYRVILEGIQLLVDYCSQITPLLLVGDDELL